MPCDIFYLLLAVFESLKDLSCLCSIITSETFRGVSETNALQLQTSVAPNSMTVIGGNLCSDEFSLDEYPFNIEL